MAHILMKPQQKLGGLPVRVHLVVSLSKFRSVPFASSTIAMKYSNELITSNRGQLNCCENGSTQQRCYHHTVTTTHSNALRTCLNYNNVTKLDIFSTRQSTDWVIQLVNHYAARLESLSVVFSTEPDHLSSFGDEISKCTKLRSLTIEILHSRQFGRLHEQMPINFATNLEQLHVTVPILTLDLLGWLNTVGVNPSIHSLSINSVANFEHAQLHSNTTEQVKHKLRNIPKMYPQIGAPLNLNLYPQLKHITMDCGSFKLPNSIISLIREISTLTQLESIQWTNVHVNSLMINSPLALTPIPSLKIITIRFGNGLFDIPENMFHSNLWAILLPFCSELIFENIFNGRTNSIQLDNYPHVKVIIK